MVGVLSSVSVSRWCSLVYSSFVGSIFSSIFFVVAAFGIFCSISLSPVMR